ncbi:MAG: DUF4012 domain-containing protein [Actinomycetes bacterium]
MTTTAPRGTRAHARHGDVALRHGTMSPPGSARPASGARGRHRAGRRRRPRAPWSTKRLVWSLGVVGLLVWLVGGVINLAMIPGHAAKAQTELQAFRDTLKAGDSKAAAKHLSLGRLQLSQAQHSASFTPLRLAKLVPGVGTTVSDLDHLLGAADIMTTSGEDALQIYQSFSGDNSTLFHNNTFNLGAIRQAQQSAAAIEVSMGKALGELQQVKGTGPRGAMALDKRRSAEAQIASLRKEIVDLRPVMQALPSAVGAGRAKTYLVAIMNPAEMRASGGAPLSVAFVRFDKGKMSIPLKGTTSVLTQQRLGELNGKSSFDLLANDPWQVPGAPQRFVNTNFNPNWPTSAEQMIRATPTNFDVKVDGVIGLDVLAISHVLRATGPIDVKDYGTLTADNVAQKLIVDGYKMGGEDTQVAARHDVNEQLMSIMLSRFTQGGGLIGKARALGDAVPGRHMQLYFTDKRLEQLAREKNLGGAVPLPSVGNLSAVYTQNTNQSKMDVFQQRTVKETVQLHKNGSALVRRTVAITNASPPFVGKLPDQKIGYDTRWAGSLVINLMPQGARLVGSPTPSRAGDVVTVDRNKDGVDQDRRTYAQTHVMLPPGASTSVTWTYVVRHATTRHGSALRLLDYVAPQSMLNAPTLELTVLPPDGWAVQPTPGWTATGQGASLTVPMDHTAVLKLQVAPR